MTPQSNFMVLAPILPGRVGELRQLLATMNRTTGAVDPANPLVPFGQFGQLHFARFLVLEDSTLNDITAFGLPRVDYPTYLTFLGDFDGLDDAFWAELVQRAGNGLREIFSYCEGFSANTDLLGWMKAHNVTAMAMYFNWVGRTVLQVREENALRLALENFVQENAASLRSMQPRQIHETLRRFVATEQQSGGLTLTPPEPTPLGWQLRKLLNLIGVPLLLLILTPFFLLYLPVFLFQLRRRELSDPDIAPRVDPAHAHQLAVQEDYEVTNQFNAFGSVKPGLFRQWLLAFLLWIISYTARHIYTRGNLARVSTIHAARWVFLDKKKRMLFASNYDGSLESYMDDFINKVGFGLNIAFSNGIAYPRTNWLVLDGSKNEQKFKYVLRRHQLPTEVWYKAYPGLTAHDLQRNTLIRQGLEKAAMNDSGIREWMQLF